MKNIIALHRKFSCSIEPFKYLDTPKFSLSILAESLMKPGFSLIGIGETSGITGDTLFNQSDSSSDSSSINLNPGNLCTNSGITHSGDDELTIVSGVSTSRVIVKELSFLSSAEKKNGSH